MTRFSVAISCMAAHYIVSGPAFLAFLMVSQNIPAAAT
jgi:hypothetical protein